LLFQHVAQVKLELVLVGELIAFDAHDGSVIGDTDQQSPSLAVEECGDGFSAGMGDRVISPIALQIPS